VTATVNRQFVNTVTIPREDLLGWLEVGLGVPYATHATLTDVRLKANGELEVTLVSDMP
jgi:hypothetical protein